MHLPESHSDMRSIKIALGAIRIDDATAGKHPSSELWSRKDDPANSRLVGNYRKLVRTGFWEMNA